MNASTIQAQETATEQQKSSPKHYPALDGLRGVAILAVFLSHFGGGHSSTNFWVHLWSGAADAGWMGVDLFFCLSGFLITGILYDTRHSKSRVKNFYARRALRIFPLYYGILFALLILTPVLHLQWHGGHVLYFLYLTNMIPILAPRLAPVGSNVALVHLWSLAVEEQFYILWPFVVWFVFDRTRILKICFAVIIAVLVLRVVLVFRAVDPFLIYSLLFTRADSLLCGAALALYVRGPGKPQLPVRWLLPGSTIATLVLFAVAGNGLHEAPIILTAGFSVIAVLATCLVYCAYSGEHWIARVSESSVLQFFGRYSYGIYIFHGLLIVSLLPLSRPLQQLVHSYLFGGVAFLLLSLVVSTGLAVMSYHFFESPILSLKKRFV